MTIAMQIINPLFGGFIPTDIAGLQLWLDANDPATLFQDSGLTTPAVLDGDPIGGWSDKSGNTNNAGQAVGAKRPTFRTAVFTGKPVARFDGVDDIMTYPVIETLPGTVFVVLTQPGVGGSDAFIGHTAIGNGFESTGPNASLKFFRIAINGTIYLNSSTINISTANVSGYDIDSSNVTIYYNGTNVGTAVHTQNSFLMNTLGFRSGDYCAGDIAEILVYNSILSPVQRNDVNSYLTTKWGI